jgi:hypothetical protein
MEAQQYIDKDKTVSHPVFSLFKAMFQIDDVNIVVSINSIATNIIHWKRSFSHVFVGISIIPRLQISLSEEIELYTRIN